MSRNPARVHIAFVLLCAASMSVFLWGNGIARGVTLTAISSLVAVSIAVCRLRTRSVGNTAWWLAFIAFCFLTATDSIWLISVDIGGAALPPQPATDLVQMVGYLFLLGAALLVVSPTARRDFGGVIDAAAAGVGGALTLWVTLLDPALDKSGAAHTARIYSLMVILILSALTGALLRAVVTSTTARPALSYFLVAVVFTLLGNVLVTTTADPVTGITPTWVSGIWPLGYAAAWAAAVHPTSHAISVGPYDPIDARLTRRRTMLLGVALGVGPLLGGLGELAGVDVDWLTVSFAQLVLIVMVLARIAQLARALHISSARLERLADLDSLTGLANRRAVDRRLETLVTCIQAYESPGVAVVFVDLNGFKAINDDYGHGVGDQLLVAVAERLAGSVRQQQGDLAGRVGGDEFVLVVEGDPAALGDSASERARATFALPFDLESGPIAISASIGLSSASKGEPTSVDELLTRADDAMYQDKRRQSESSGKKTPSQ